MDEIKLKELVLLASIEQGDRRKLACADAFELAETHKVALLDIARICNQEEIRINKCQLGCFR